MRARVQYPGMVKQQRAAPIKITAEPKGTPVKHADVVAYAAPRCKLCRGTGIVNAILGSGKAKDAPRAKALCDCAHERFLRVCGPLVQSTPKGKLHFLPAPIDEATEKLLAPPEPIPAPATEGT